MPVLQVIGDRPGAGKTCFIGAFLSLLAKKGQGPSYFRPFSGSPQADPDVAFFARYLAEADPSTPQIPAPQQMPPLTEQSPALEVAVGQGVVDAVYSLGAEARLALIEGPDLAPTGGPTSPLAAELARQLDSQVLLVFRYSPTLSASQVVQAGASLGHHLVGIVVNGVTRHRWRQVQHELLPKLKAQGLPVLGAIPEDRAMLAVTVQQVADHLAGRLMHLGPIGQEHPDEAPGVERLLLGGNMMDSGAIYFGRLPNQAVITRAARPDIQLASLTPNTRCLVLTGGEEPTEYIRVEARQRSVPMILVPGDTLTTVAALEGLLMRASPYSVHKLERFNWLMEQYLDLTGLVLGLT